VRLFLDAHISGPRIARALREAGHDVRAADEERELDGLTDEELLSIAAAQERIFVTFDVKDFPVIARRWAEAGRAHAGRAIMVGIDHGEFGTILDTIAHALAGRPTDADWTDLTLFLARNPSG
jgi:NAD(P)-dependent dehydrogenase (short-subunit alcohol dehydrogenase family)